MGERRGHCQEGNQVAAVVSLGTAHVDELGVLAGCLYEGINWRIFLDRPIHKAFLARVRLATGGVTNEDASSAELFSLRHGGLTGL